MAQEIFRRPVSSADAHAGKALNEASITGSRAVSMFVTRVIIVAHVAKDMFGVDVENKIFSISSLLSGVSTAGFVTIA
jgi:hypothetical protein